MLVHAIWRSIALVLLAVFLTSSWSAKTEWIFTNVLAQIGLGYTFLFLVAWLKPRWQLATVAAILVLYWGAFAVYPKPPADTDPAKVHLPADWPRLQGFASHWEKHTNLAARFDGWFLNLFPHYDKKGATRIRYEYNEGGYTTLNFVPSLATMILGLLAGELIRSRLKSAAKFGILLAAGLAGLGLGWLFLHQLAWICPVVKRIWTPTWVIHSAGWAFLLLAVFFLVIDVIRIRFWAMPLVWVGMNSIAAYCMSQLLKPWFRENMQRHFGKEVFDAFGRTWSPITETAFFLLLVWAACWWMYRKKFFVKI
jgi:predicted acyltransferase